MKSFPRHFCALWIGLFLLAASCACASPGDSIRFERLFADASRAYDENRLPESIAAWESLLAEGQALPEILYNLGNSYYRNGDLGKAIRAYRHAQTLAPRDPDVLANLGFAAQTAGVDLPRRPFAMRLLLDASSREWLAAASVSFWSLFAFLAAWILSPRFRFLSRPAALVAAIALALSLAGLLAHSGLRRSPECVVVSGPHKLFSGPLDSATPLLSLPEGAIVRKLGARGSWFEVQADAARGWIPSSSLEPVLRPNLPANR